MWLLRGTGLEGPWKAGPQLVPPLDGAGDITTDHCPLPRAGTSHDFSRLDLFATSPGGRGSGR